MIPESELSVFSVSLVSLFLLSLPLQVCSPGHGSVLVPVIHHVHTHSLTVSLSPTHTQTICVCRHLLLLCPLLFLLIHLKLAFQSLTVTQTQPVTKSNIYPLFHKPANQDVEEIIYKSLYTLRMTFGGSLQRTNRKQRVEESKRT